MDKANPAFEANFQTTTCASLHQVGEASSEQIEYQEKIAQLRKIFTEETAALEKACQEFKDPVLSVLDQQATLRPVSSVEKDMLLAQIHHRFLG